MNVKETGKAIAYLRKAKNLTQNDIAEQLHISDKAVSKWERGLSVPDVSLLAKLSIMLDIDIESLLEGNVAHYDHRWVGLIVLDSNAADDFLMRTILFDKPMVYFQLSYFMLVGIRKVCIVCSKETEAYISGIADWNQFGIELVFGINGFLEKENTSDLMALYGNTFMYGPDLTRHFQRAMANVSRQKEQCSIMFIQCSNGRYSLGEFEMEPDSGNIESGIRYSVCPILFLSHRAAKENMSIILKHEMLLLKLLKSKTAYIKIGRGMLTKKIENLVDANDIANLVRLLQNISGDKIADMEEIARKRGFI